MLVMNWKKFTAAFTVSLILFSFSAGLLFVKVAKANPIPNGKPTNPPSIVIQSPLNITYNQNDVQLNFSIPGISHWWTGAYHLTDVYYECDGKSVHTNLGGGTNTEQFFANLTGLTKGVHILTLHVIGAGLYYVNYPNSSDKADYSIESTQTVTFSVDKELETNTTTSNPSLTASPSPTPFAALIASLSESASALNYGNTINFTVSAEGGIEPYTFAWNIDGQLAENSSAQYFSINTLAIGSHFVYVQVNDANNNSAKTLTVSFEILPVSSSSSSPSSTGQPTIEPTSSANPSFDAKVENQSFPSLIIEAVVIVAAVALAVGLLVYFKKRDG
jgi:hypothetical protein